MAEVPLSLLSQQLDALFAEDAYAAGFALGRHILRYYPRHLATYRRMGLAALSVGLFADSLDLLQRALSADPEDGAMWQAMSQAATKLDAHPEAEVAIAYASDLLPDQPSYSLIARGHVALRAGQWKEAYTHFREGYRVAPHRMDAALGMAEALYRLEQYELIQTVAQYILQELPYSLKAHLLLILSDRHIPGEWVDSTRHLRIIRGLDPTGTYSRRWFQPQELMGIFPAESMIPAWDASERWDFVPA